MQSSTAVAGMDALSYPCENILTRRANQWHCSIIAQFARRPWPCPTTGSSSAIAGKKSLPTIEVAPARRSSMGSPKLHRLATAKGRLSRCRAARASDARARGDISDQDRADFLFRSGTGRLAARANHHGQDTGRVERSWEFGFAPGEMREHWNHLDPHIATCAHYIGVARDTIHTVAIEYQEFGDERHSRSRGDAKALVVAVALELARRPEGPANGLG